MAKFHYDITGAEPIVRDCPVYDAATLVKGEFVIKDATNAADNHRLITGAASLVDAVGIMNETLALTDSADYGDFVTTAKTTTADAISSVAAGGATTAYSGGNRYGKVIINPFAVYLTEYSQAAADDVALTQAWSTTTLTIGSLEDNWDGGWVLGANQSATSNFEGQLRHVTAAAAGSCTLNAAPTVAGTTDDMIIKILPVNKILLDLNAGATAIASNAAVDTFTAVIVENYITSPNKPLEPLRSGAHAYDISASAISLNLGSSVKAYADVLLYDHLYNVS